MTCSMVCSDLGVKDKEWANEFQLVPFACSHRVGIMAYCGIIVEVTGIYRTFPADAVVCVLFSFVLQLRLPTKLYEAIRKLLPDCVSQRKRDVLNAATLFLLEARPWLIQIRTRAVDENASSESSLPHFLFFPPRLPCYRPPVHSHYQILSVSASHFSP